jgi:hypothetical protein
MNWDNNCVDTLDEEQCEVFKQGIETILEQAELANLILNYIGMFIWGFFVIVMAWVIVRLVASAFYKLINY